MRAKAVIQRDLEEKREARLAREAPTRQNLVQSAEQKQDAETTAQPREQTPPQETVSVNDTEIVEPEVPVTRSLSNHTSALASDAIPTATMIANTPIEMSRTDSQQNPTLIKTSQATSQPIGLGITTDLPISDSQTQDSLPVTAEGTSAVDSLFDTLETAGDDPFNFGDMDFSMDANTNGDPSQAANADFDLSTFGNDTQDFNMLDIPVTTSTNANNVAVSKVDEDIFADLGATGDASMDLDLGDMDMGEGNTFDDLFTAGDGDDLNTGTGEMEHGEFDQSFFGMD